VGNPKLKSATRAAPAAAAAFSAAPLAMAQTVLNAEYAVLSSQGETNDDDAWIHKR
jgi:hypothetical protein